MAGLLKVRSSVGEMQHHVRRHGVAATHQLLRGCKRDTAAGRVAVKTDVLGSVLIDLPRRSCPPFGGRRCRRCPVAPMGAEAYLAVRPAEVAEHCFWAVVASAQTYAPQINASVKIAAGHHTIRVGPHPLVDSRRQCPACSALRRRGRETVKSLTSFVVWTGEGWTARAGRGLPEAPILREMGVRSHDAALRRGTSPHPLRGRRRG